MAFQFRRGTTRTPSSSRNRFRPQVIAFEDRSVPATLIGLATTGALPATSTLVQFDSNTPGTIQRAVPVAGLNLGETLIGIDFRPSNNLLYGVSQSTLPNTMGRVFTIDTTTGAATPVATLSADLVGADFGLDFNPTSNTNPGMVTPIANALRIVSDTGQSYRVNVDSGAVTTEMAALNYDQASAQNTNYFAPDPVPTTPGADNTMGQFAIVAAGYTRNLTPTGTFATTLYAIDSTNDVLVLIGGPNGGPAGTPANPNGGVLTVVGALTTADNPFGNIDFGPQTTFDIEQISDNAFLADGTQFYRLNITSGAVSTPVTIGGGFTLSGLAVVPPTAGPGTISLSGATFTFDTTRNPLAITVTRTGGTAGTDTVTFATADGTAVAGVDYLATSGTLTFLPGQTTQQIFLDLINPPAPNQPAKTFTLTLSNATGASALGTTSAATITIPATAAAPAPGTPTPNTNQPVAQTRFFATGAGAGGGPQVNVYDAVSGAQVASFFPYESTFTGGVQVAVGDINGDGVDDIVVGTGVGGGPRVQVFDGTTLTASGGPTAIANFFAFESTFTGGVQVATGDVNGDGFDDIIVGTGVGGAPRVQAFSGIDISDTNQTVLANFFAYESEFRGGVQVAARDINGDGFDDIIAGSGVGGGPRVQAFDGKTATPGGTPTVLANFFAYDPSFRNGVNVAAGDINGDGLVDIVTGPGDGGGPDVRAYTARTQSQIAGFFAFDQTLTGGARVAATDLNSDGVDDIIAASGPGGPSTVTVRDATGAEILGIDDFAGSFTGGVFVGG